MVVSSMETDRNQSDNPANARKSNFHNAHSLQSESDMQLSAYDLSEMSEPQACCVPEHSANIYLLQEISESPNFRDMDTKIEASIPLAYKREFLLREDSPSPINNRLFRNSFSSINSKQHWVNRGNPQSAFSEVEFTN